MDKKWGGYCQKKKCHEWTNGIYFYVTHSVLIFLRIYLFNK